jgi:RNA polymerase sigma-70 factor (ECF subfamily)
MGVGLTEFDPDADLLKRVAKDDPSAIKEMVARKLPRLLALAMRMLNDRGEAEDVAQETFVRIWKHAPSWQPGAAKFDTWVHRVALNLCYDKLRNKPQAEFKELDEESADQVDTALKPDETMMAMQQRDQVAYALAKLPVRQREALVLQYYQELSNIEAASLMEISVDALESLLSRARRNMRSFLLAE